MDKDEIWHGGSPGHIVLDRDRAPPPQKGAEQLQRFAHVYCGQMADGWMDQDATWYGGRLWPRRHCVRWGPSSLSPKMGSAAHTFRRPMSVVTK